MTATTVTLAFITGWVSHFGIPSSITTDRGRQFESNLWAELMHSLGTVRLRTTAYHPITNGLVERFHRQLKATLRACSDPLQWVDALPLILLGSRTTLKQDLGCSVAELVYGTTLRPRRVFFFTSTASTDVDAASYVKQLKVTMRHLQATPPRVSDRPKVYISKDLTSSSHVFVGNDAVRKPLQQPYDGPFKVLLRSDKYFTLDINGHKDTVSVDRLNQHIWRSHSTKPPSPLQPSQLQFFQLHLLLLVMDAILSLQTVLKRSSLRGWGGGVGGCTVAYIFKYTYMYELM